MYSKVTIIPATTIYYEDNFVKTESYEWVNEGWTEMDTSLWATEGATINGTQAEDRPGFYSLGSTDANNIYGYDDVNLNMDTYSMGSALKATVDYDHMAVVEFSFYGTGFDVISLTSSATGTILVDVYPCNANGTPSTEAIKQFGVDTYYGYSATHAYEYTYTNGAWEKVDLGLASNKNPATDPEKVKEMLDSLKHGDRVTTIGGIYGTIMSIKDDTITLAVGAARTEMVFARWAIRGVEEVTVENDGEQLA